MKKILFIFLCACCYLLVSCDSKETVSGSNTSKKNLEATQTVKTAFDSGDISKIDSAVASDFVDHTDRGDKNRDSLKAMIMAMRSDVPDMKSTITRELADDDYVFTWMKITGTSKGMMMPPGPFDMNVIQVSRMKDGKIVEHWSFLEQRDMMKFSQMMQNMPHPPPPDVSKKMDSTNNKAGKEKINKVDTKTLDKLKKDSSKM